MFAISNTQKSNSPSPATTTPFHKIKISKPTAMVRQCIETFREMKSAIVSKRSTAWMGLNSTKKVKTLDGSTIKRRLIFLDATASPLVYKPIQSEVQDFLTHSYANSHTQGHWRGRSTTETLDAARHAVGTWLGYDPQKDVVIFDGAGATGPTNFLAQVLFPKTLRILSNPQLDEETKNTLFHSLDLNQQQIASEILAKPWVITTEMEHHANQLPWFDMKNILIVPVDQTSGELDMKVLQGYLTAYKNKIRLVTITGASNVTGIKNPIYDIAKMSHEAGAELCVDAAQLAPHDAIEKRPQDGREHLDYILVSPHKFGVPGTPGVLIANKDTFIDRRNLVKLGGGMVNSVFINPPRFTPTPDLAAGEEPGTPNIPGIVAIGLAATRLMNIMPQLQAHEHDLTTYLMDQIANLKHDGVVILGSQDSEKRVGVVSIHVEDVEHPIVTAYLNDHWNIAVRNGCFCAQPLVLKLSSLSQEAIEAHAERLENGDRSMLPGYVRLSLGEYNTKADVDTLIDALTELVHNKLHINSLYEIKPSGDALRKDGFQMKSAWNFEAANARLSSPINPRIFRIKSNGRPVTS